MLAVLCTVSILWTVAKANCYTQGRCYDNFVDQTDGEFQQWMSCNNSTVCEGGPYYANEECACACILAENQDEACSNQYVEDDKDNSGIIVFAIFVAFLVSGAVVSYYIDKHARRELLNRMSSQLLDEYLREFNDNMSLGNVVCPEILDPLDIEANGWKNTASNLPDNFTNFVEDKFINQFQVTAPQWIFEFLIWHIFFLGPLAVVIPFVFGLVHLICLYPNKAKHYFKMSWFALFPSGKRLEISGEVKEVDINRGGFIEFIRLAVFLPLVFSSMFVLALVVAIPIRGMGLCGWIKFSDKLGKHWGMLWEVWFELDWTHAVAIVPDNWFPEVPPSIDTYDPSQKCVISLRAKHGLYLAVPHGGVEWHLYCDDSNEAVRFTSIPSDDEAVTLQSHEGRYISIKPNKQIIVLQKKSEENNEGGSKSDENDQNSSKSEEIDEDVSISMENDIDGPQVVDDDEPIKEILVVPQQPVKNDEDGSKSEENDDDGSNAAKFLVVEQNEKFGFQTNDKYLGAPSDTLKWEVHCKAEVFAENEMWTVVVHQILDNDVNEPLDIEDDATDFVEDKSNRFQIIITVIQWIFEFLVWHIFFLGPIAVVLPFVFGLVSLVFFHPITAKQCFKLSWFALFPSGKRLEISGEMQEWWKNRCELFCCFELLRCPVILPLYFASIPVLIFVVVFPIVEFQCCGCIKFSDKFKRHWNTLFEVLFQRETGLECSRAIAIVPWNWFPELPPSITTYDPSQKCVISLRAHHKLYLAMPGDAVEWHLYCDDSNKGARFTSIPSDNEAVTLQSYKGQYMCIDPIKEILVVQQKPEENDKDGSKAVKNDEDASKSGENIEDGSNAARFIVVEQNGKFGFQTNEKYLGSPSDPHHWEAQPIHCNADVFAKNEMWTVVVHQILDDNALEAS